MKTKQFISFALISGLLSLTGCGDDQNAGTTENNEPVELQISPKVVLTRAVVDGTEFPNGTSIGVYATGADYTDAKSNNYAVYTSSSGAWSSSAANKIFLTNAAAKIHAYYPSTTKYDASFTIPVTLVETADITAKDNAAKGTPIAAAATEVDGMHATPVGSVTNKANKNVKLDMNHALSMVTFRVYKAADYKGTGSLTKIVMKDINTTGTTLSKGTSPKMNITTGVITPGDAADATFTRNITDGYTLVNTADGSKRFSILVLPISTSIGNNNIQATFTIDGADYDVSLTPPSENGGAWLAGKNYLYTVKLSGTELTISSVNIAQWQGVAGGELDIK